MGFEMHVLVPHLIHMALPAIAFDVLMEYHSSSGPLQFFENIIYGVICNFMVTKNQTLTYPSSLL